LEIIEVTKKPVPKTNYSESPYTPLFIGLKTNRRELKERLKNRLELRIKKGLLKETEKLTQRRNLLGTIRIIRT